MARGTFAERLHAVLLRAFPRDFRERFGADMQETFVDRRRDGPPLTLCAWLAVIVDLLRQGMAERLATALDPLLDPIRTPTTRGRTMDTLRQDLRFARRTFASNRAATLIAIVVLAFGIGATTAIFSVVESVLLRSLPYRDPDRLVDVGPIAVARRNEGYEHGTGSHFAYETWRDQRAIFEGVASFSGEEPILSGLGDPERIDATSVTPNFFTLLGAQPEYGRTIVADDSLPDAAAVVVLSHAFWATRFAADPRALGQTMMLGGVAHAIVGIMPSSFHYPERAIVWRAYAPARMSESQRKEIASRRAYGGYWSVARLRADVTPARAMAMLDVAIAPIAASGDWKDVAAIVVPLRRQLTGSVQRPLMLVFGAVVLVLLVACANVANIQLARAASRERELALRLAVGARRTRLLRQLLTESVVLALIGGAGGVLLAYVAVPLLVRLGGDQLPHFTDIDVDGRVLLGTMLVSMLSGIAFGIVPALLSVRRANPQMLKAGTSGSGTSAAKHRVGDAFVIAQLALTVVLLAGAALLATSFERLVNVDPGFVPERVVLAELRNTGHKGDTATIALANALLERVRAIPGVASAAISTGTPLSEGALLFGIDLLTPEPRKGDGLVVYASATPDYFATLGMSLKRGRLTRNDAADVHESILVNEAFVRAFYPGVDPIGQRIKFMGKTPGTIVGVVGDTKGLALDEPAPAKIYQPFDAAPSEYLKLIVRASGSPDALSAAIRTAVRDVDPGLPVDKLQTMRALMSTSLSRQRFYTTLLSIFATIALVMASAGIYGVVSYMVTRRTRELGVRVALGATARDVRGLVLGRGGRLALGGVSLGIVAALWATRALRSMLYEISPSDPLVLGAVAVVLAAVVLLASWAPARRAASVDPVTALRADG